MKKIALVALLLVTLQTASAQLGERVSFGVRAGIAQTNFSCSEEATLLGLSSKQASNYSVSSKKKWNYNVGVVVDIPIVKKWNLSVQTGLWFTEKKGGVDGKTSFYTDASKYGTSKNKYTGGYSTTTLRKYDYSVMFLSLPVLATYHYNFGPIRAEANFGPYVEYGIGDGESTFEKGTAVSGTLNGKDVSKAYNPDVSEGDFFGEDASHFGYGLTFGLGAYWKNIYLGAKYDLGLNDYFKDYDVDYTLKANVLSICLGYNF